jgi:hypothetical protein
MKILRSLVYVFTIILVFSYSVQAQQVKWNWVKGANGSGNEEGTAIAVDLSGNVYVAGNFFSATFRFGINTLNNKVSTSTDIFLAKYTPTGDLTWVKNFGSKGNELVTDIKIDAAGNIYMTGTFESDTLDFGNGNQIYNTSVWVDLFVVKLNNSGIVQWARSAGGKDLDYSNSIAVDASGNVYITGYYTSDTLIFNKSPLAQIVTPPGFTYDLFIAKYNNSGTFQWVRNAGSDMDDRALSVAVDNNGNAIITGFFQSSSITFGSFPLTNENNNSDMFLVKYNPTGDVIWTKIITGFWNETGNAITTDASGNIYVCGEYSSDNINIGAYPLTNSNPGQASEEIYVAKYNSSGTAQWAKTAQGINAEYAKDISVDANGNVYVTGAFGSPTFKVGTTVLNNSNTNGSGDIFVIKFNSTGGFITVLQGQSTGDDDSKSIAAFGNNAYITGTYKANPQISFGAYPLLNTGNYDIFISCLGLGVSIKDEEFDQHFSIYPNPVSEKFTLSSNNLNTGKFNCRIYDITGKLVSEAKDLTSGNATQISVPDGYKGLLLINITTEKGQSFSRSVICN